MNVWGQVSLGERGYCSGEEENALAVMAPDFTVEKEWLDGRSQQGKVTLLHRPLPGDTDILEVGTNHGKGRALLTLQWLLLHAERRKIVATVLGLGLPLCLLIQAVRVLKRSL